MEFVKNIAEYERVDKLILGAWGAGAFGFRGIEVAKMWHDVWRTPSPIKEIQFAVIDHLGSVSYTHLTLPTNSLV